MALLSPRRDNIKQTTDELSKKGTWLAFYHADWCPHCVSFQETWKKIKKECKALHIKVVEIEADVLSELRSSSPGNSRLHNVGGFPTISSIRDGKPYKSYNGPRLLEDVMAFAKTLLDVKVVKERSRVHSVPQAQDATGATGATGAKKKVVRVRRQAKSI